MQLQTNKSPARVRTVGIESWQVVVIEHGLVVAGILVLDLGMETRRLVLGIIELGEAVAYLA